MLGCACGGVLELIALVWGGVFALFVPVAWRVRQWLAGGR